MVRPPFVAQELPREDDILRLDRSAIGEPGGRVDVVFLDEANDVLRQRIMTTGRVLICRDREAWVELRVRTMREYGDREWVRDLMQRAQRRRLEGGLPSGRSGTAVESLRRLGKLSR